MSTLRKQQRANYTNVDNDLINDYSLSFRAVGIAVYLLSKPNDWNINMKHLERVRKEGREAIRSAMRELSEAGYTMRSQEHAKDGTITTITHIADYPAFANVGTPESRTKGYGYDYQEDDPAEPTDGKPTIGANDRIVTTDLVTTDTYISFEQTSLLSDSDERKPTPQQELFEATCKCVGWDHRLITKEQAGQVAQTTGVLKKAGYTVGDLRKFHKFWFAEDWRGKKGQFPTLSQLRAEIGKAKPAIAAATSPFHRIKDLSR